MKTGMIRHNQQYMNSLCHML